MPETLIFIHGNRFLMNKSKIKLICEMNFPHFAVNRVQYNFPCILELNVQSSQKKKKALKN